VLLPVPVMPISAIRMSPGLYRFKSANCSKFVFNAFEDDFAPDVWRFNCFVKVGCVGLGSLVEPGCLIGGWHDALSGVFWGSLPNIHIELAEFCR